MRCVKKWKGSYKQRDQEKKVFLILLYFPRSLYQYSCILFVSWIIYDQIRQVIINWSLVCANKTSEYIELVTHIKETCWKNCLSMVLMSQKPQKGNGGAMIENRKEFSSNIILQHILPIELQCLPIFYRCIYKKKIYP